MKKTLILLGLLAITTAGVNAAENTAQNNYRRPLPPPQAGRQFNPQEHAKREVAFEQRLGLTEQQKQQAKELRLKGHDQMKPVMDKLNARIQEAELVKNSTTLSQQEQQQKLNSIDGDVKALHKQLHEMRRENMKDFESILTDEQKKTLSEMKQEGRQEFQKKHNAAKPCVMPKKFDTK